LFFQKSSTKIRQEF